MKEDWINQCSRDPESLDNDYNTDTEANDTGMLKNGKSISSSNRDKVQHFKGMDSREKWNFQPFWLFCVDKPSETSLRRDDIFCKDTHSFALCF